MPNHLHTILMHMFMPTNFPMENITYVHTFCSTEYAFVRFKYFSFLASSLRESVVANLCGIL